MNSATSTPDYSPTSADGAMMSQVSRTLCIGALCFGISSTSAVEPMTERTVGTPVSMPQTSAGGVVPGKEQRTNAISELRMLSGLTWDQLARVFGVSRRSIHFWASGKVPTPANEETLNRVLAAIRRVDRGSASANRSLLLGAREDGTIPFDLLANSEYERFVSIVGEAAQARRRPLTRKSPEDVLSRRPMPLIDRLQTQQDSVHTDLPGGRIARSVRIRDRGRDG